MRGVRGLKNVNLRDDPLCHLDYRLSYLVATPAAVRCVVSPFAATPAAVYNVLARPSACRRPASPCSRSASTPPSSVRASSLASSKRDSASRR